MSSKFLVGAIVLGIWGAAAILWVLKSDKPAPNALVATQPEEVVATPEPVVVEPIQIKVVNYKKAEKAKGNGSKKTGIRPPKIVNFDMKVINTSLEPQTISVMTEGFFEQWQTNNPEVWILSSQFSADKALTKTLKPGEAYEKEIQLVVPYYDPQKDRKEIVFKLGFTSIGGSKTYWSNDIKFPLEEPVKRSK